VVNVIEETRKQQSKRMTWWREARFGMFIHWGLYALSAGMWKGEYVPGIGEWIQQRAQIPIKEYEQLAKQFNPVEFKAKEWVQLAREAGMKWMVITAKHHDGFCLFDTKFTDYNIVKATPFKRDPLKELAEACREKGVRLGFYYSQTLDWHHPNGMGNDWDYNPAKQDFTKYLREYVKPQLYELLTNYGPIAVIWFDIATPTPELAVELKQLVRELQPNTIINGRIGGWRIGERRAYTLGNYTEMGDNKISEQRIEDDWETPATINDTWGYKSYDHNWKSAGNLVQKLVTIVSRGGNYLLNVGPTAEGIIPEPSIRSLKGVGEWLKMNGESIYGATASPIAISPTTPYQCTTKRGKYYIHIFAWPWDKKFKVSRVGKEVKRVYLLADPSYGELKFNQEGKDVVINVPDKAPNSIDTVVILEINE
jgi:alpha-L-fucosidase